MDESGEAQRSAPVLHLLLYALAWGGGSVAYIPFLTLLLPVRIENLVGAGQSVSWLAYLAFIGAIAASLGAIVFGYLSDISARRRSWIFLGLAISSGLLAAFSQATSFVSFAALLIVWQCGLNMMLAPLAAWAGDWVPDSQKGLLGGLMAFAPAMGAWSGAVVTMPGLAGPDLRLVAVAGIVCLCLLPVLVIVRHVPHRPVRIVETAEDPPAFALLSDPGVRLMWLARLAVQVAEASLFAYLYLWLRSIDPSIEDHATAKVFGTVLVCSAPLALLIGYWSDRRGKPMVPLIGCALVSAVGLAGMALASTRIEAFAAYAVFGLASAAFLALHSAQTLRVLPNPHRRGRDLGLFNLTNTVPSLIMPWLVLLLVPHFGFGAMFAILAGLAMCAALILVRMPGEFERHA